MLALDIAAGAVDMQGKTILPLDFTMARNEAVREDSYRAAAAAIKAELSVGRDVAMVNLGDVSVYATAYYILERIRDDGFETVMCPGVTSFCAVAARLGRSLTRMDEPLHILSGSTDLNNALALPGTKVVMKSGKAIHETAEALKRHGLLANAGMVADCGLETEQVYTDLRQLPEEISYFATIVAD
ncbi:precorrin-2 C20-methyltransferase [Firmicutes bacterium CAG:110]|nr:precorrin-2 C20-methyltransferase [Firmicutes bacterium CAG:110]